MHRLFAAIRPPKLIRETLLRSMGGVSHARWQSDEQLHLTLRFIGEVDRHQAEDVAAALGGVHHPAFGLALSGIGYFDRKGRIESLWVGISPPEPVDLLHRKVDQALVRVGIVPESRAFLPHITIARFGRRSGPLSGMIEDRGGLTSSPAQIAEFCLYESHLGREGSHYEIVSRYPLYQP